MSTEIQTITIQYVIDSLGEFLKSLIPPEKYLFNWNSVPGNDSDRIINYLRKDLEIDYINNPTINKSDDKLSIKITTGKKPIEIKRVDNTGQLIINPRQKYKLELKEDKKEDNIVDFKTYSKINTDTSLSPFILGFFKMWGNSFNIGNEKFEAQCERDLNKKWRQYLETTKIPQCLQVRENCRELLNIDCTWVPKNSGPYYLSPESEKQKLPKPYPTKSYIYLAVEHAEDNAIKLEGSNMGSALTAIRKLGYIKSSFKIVIYKPFKGEQTKNEQKIQEQLNLICDEIKRIELQKDKEKTETWFIIMLFNYYKNCIYIGENDLLLRGYEIDNNGKIIKSNEDDYYKYQITNFYA